MLPNATAGSQAGNEATAEPVVTRPEIFSTKELTSLKCSCEKDDVAAWHVTLMARLKSKCAPAHKVLTYTDKQVAALSPEAKAIALAYDVVLGGHLLAVVQADTPHGKLVRSTIAEREEDNPGTIASSGRAILKIILETIRPTCGSELEVLEAELKKPFFRMGMADVNVKLSARRLKALRAQLPVTARGGKRELLRDLLSKFPPELEKKAKKYAREMCEAEVCGQPYKWTYGQLASILATLIATGPAAEANAADYPRGGVGGADRALFTAAFKGCLHCGLDNHETRDCKVQPCGFCNLRFCFGIRKKGKARSCLVKRLIEGGKITDADIGFNGKPLPPHLIEQINERVVKIKAKTNETNTAGVQTEKNAQDDDDDDDDGAYESELCELDVCC